MNLIYYLFVPLLLFHVPYKLNFLPYYLLIANGTQDVGIFELLILHRSYQVNNKVVNVRTIHFKILLYWNFVCNVMQRVGFVHTFL